MLIPFRSLLPSLTALLAFTATLTGHAATVPDSPDLLAPATVNLDAFKLEKSPVLSLDSSTTSPLLKVVFPGNSGYPGINLPIPGGAWDLSAYAGVEAEVANVGQTRVNIGLRIDNPGDWRKSPWNSNNIWLAPGETKTLKVTFGQSYGNPGYALDASKVSNVKLLADNPKQDAPILIKAVRAFGTATERPAPAASEPSATASAPAPAGAPLFTPTFENISTLKTEKDPVVSVEGSALKVAFPNGGDYPGLDLPLTGGVANLSAFAGLQAEVTNIGQSRLNVNLRADNPGDWRKNPWNTGNAWIAPGQTATVKVVFGQSYGHPGYALDAARVSNIKLFVERPKPDAAILVKNIVPFGSATDRPVAGSASDPAPAAPAGKDATFSPPISGELLDLGQNKLSGFTYGESSAVIENGKIKVTFQAGSNYPNIKFPVPQGGWNLDAFGGIEVTVTNPNERRVTVFLRADNPGHWKTEPWNTETVGVGPGETKTLTLTFGQQNGAPAFPLNSKRISAIQVFIVRPKTDTTLVLSNLKASGSPSATAAGLTSPADRTVPVTPPDWLGKRPPVDGNWVQTLSEEFEGNQLNEKLWTTRFPWDGPQPGQLQRYAPENVSVSNGVLLLKSEKKFGHENNDPARPTRDYTSGLIQSYDKFAQRYGYFEARVKFPTARGLWPAFWLMPDRGAASGLGQWQRRDTGNGAMEIDIIEHLTEWGPGRNNVAVHWDGYGDKHKSWGTSQLYFGPTPDGWHNFGLLWEPGKLTWFIDGKKVVEFENERVSNVASYIKLNTQMGGWATKDVDLSKLPDFFKVDYVRVWQLKERL